MKRWLAPAIFCIALAAIAAGSASEHVKLALHTHGSLHPWVHLVAFGCVSLAAMFAARNAWLRGLLVIAILALAWGTEYREHLLDGWPVEQPDVQHDVIGTLVGTAIGVAVFRPRRPFAKG